MNRDRFYINELSAIRGFCLNSDKEDVYMYIYSLQQENQSLQQENQSLKDIMKQASNLVEEIKLHYQQHPTMIPDVKINKLDDLLKESE